MLCERVVCGREEEKEKEGADGSAQQKTRTLLNDVGKNTFTLTLEYSMH